jgi:hypothetical protein
MIVPLVPMPSGSTRPAPRRIGCATWCCLDSGFGAVAGPRFLFWDRSVSASRPTAAKLETVILDLWVRASRSTAGSSVDADHRIRLERSAVPLIGQEGLGGITTPTWWSLASRRRRALVRRATQHRHGRRPRRLPDVRYSHTVCRTPPMRCRPNLNRGTQGRVSLGQWPRWPSMFLGA